MLEITPHQAQEVTSTQPSPSPNVMNFLAREVAQSDPVTMHVTAILKNDVIAAAREARVAEQAASRSDRANSALAAIGEHADPLLSEVSWDADDLLVGVVEEFTIDQKTRFAALRVHTVDGKDLALSAFIPPTTLPDLRKGLAGSTVAVAVYQEDLNQPSAPDIAIEAWALVTIPGVRVQDVPKDYRATLQTADPASAAVTPSAVMPDKSSAAYRAEIAGIISREFSLTPKSAAEVTDAILNSRDSSGVIPHKLIQDRTPQDVRDTLAMQYAVTVEQHEVTATILANANSGSGTETSEIVTQGLAHAFGSSARLFTQVEQALAASKTPAADYVKKQLKNTPITDLDRTALEKLDTKITKHFNQTLTSLLAESKQQTAPRDQTEVPSAETLTPTPPAWTRNLALMTAYRDAHNRMAALRTDTTIPTGSDEFSKTEHLQNVTARELIHANAPLIHKTVGNYVASYNLAATMEDFDAYVCVAEQAVLHAAISYDPDVHTHAPSTHLTNAIKWGLSDAIHDKSQNPIIGGQILNPKSYAGGSNTTIRKHAPVRSLDLELSWSGSPNRAVAMESGNLGTTSLDQVIELHHAGGSKVLSPLEEAVRNELREKTIEVLASLSPREREVLIMRHGLSASGKCHFYEEIGEHFNLSRERVRQIEAKALMKLRHPNRSGPLRDFFRDLD